ncbi:IclR family transcriptional regulator [Azospirillum sp. Sh1]|uniref:IclR family transcriptional regulator n=1 Tax=Azospirillum sp. Sh1 TaxID=2607285 RepID=UPI00165DC56D|nr:IclR family transcriptional regulator [Azospirillum sp. Sh1]
MNSLRRMLDILDLFAPDRPTIDVDFICERLGYTQASAYRYVREFVEFGLLVRIPSGYTLGPKIIELNRQMTEHDPLLVASRDLLSFLVDETGLSALLSERYDDTVINIQHTPGREGLPLNYGRGRPMDLFRSATARVILAYLLPRQLKRLYEQHVGEPTLQNLGVTWKEFSKSMLQVRKNGYCISFGELDPEKAGLAAPIFDEKKRVLGSITLVGGLDRFSAFNENYLAKIVTDAASEITRRMAATARPDGDNAIEALDPDAVEDEEE